MTSINFTSKIIYPVNKFIYEELTDQGALKKARIGHLALMPTSFITTAIDTIIGIGSSIGAILTGGKHKGIYQFSSNHLENSKFLLTYPYLNFLRTINPQAILSDSNKSIISVVGNGFITDYLNKSLTKIADKYSISNNVLKRHLASRLLYVSLALSSIVTRAIDGVIGIVAGMLSIVTVGKFESLNNLSFRALQVTGIIYDLIDCFVKIINPWAEFNKGW